MNNIHKTQLQQSDRSDTINPKLGERSLSCCPSTSPLPTSDLSATFDKPATNLTSQTNRQDWEVCELTQLAVSSRSYTPGLYSNQESLLAAIDREVLQALGH